MFTNCSCIGRRIRQGETGDGSSVSFDRTFTGRNCAMSGAQRKTPGSGINCRVFFKGCYKMLRGVIY